VRRRLAPWLALVLAVAAVACETKSSTSTGPAPVKCQVSLTPPSNSIEANGGKDAVTVSTEPECSWSASSGAAWITGLTPTSGQGNGRIAFDAAANPTGTARQGDVAVNDQLVPIQQKPAACRFDVTPSAQIVGPAGGTISIAVNTLVGCVWQAKVDAAWVALTATSGTGSGNVSLRVDANAGAARSTSLVVAGETVTLTQSSGTPAPPNCVFSLDRSSESIGAAGGSVTVAVTGTAGCTRIATSGAPWITVTAGATGTGSGAVTFTATANTGAARVGTLTIAGLAFTVTQAAAAGPPAPPPPPQPSCSYSIAPNSQSIGAAGGAGTTITISTTAGCGWTASSQVSWITLTSATNGSGPGTVTFNVALNDGSARNGSLTVAGQTFTVSQAAAAPSCSFSINPNSQSIGAAGGVGATVTITTSAACTWTAKSNDAWITLLTGANGTGPGAATFKIEANGGAGRTGTLTIAGRTFTVTQASGCTFSINPTNQSIDNDGGAGTPVGVTAGTGCSWTATSNDSWITVTSGASGSGNGTVRFTVDRNTGKKRTGTMTIAGRTFTVDQDKN
jgi:hypothetical protein